MHCYTTGSGNSSSRCEPADVGRDNTGAETTFRSACTGNQAYDSVVGKPALPVQRSAKHNADVSIICRGECFDRRYECLIHIHTHYWPAFICPLGREQRSTGVNPSSFEYHRSKKRSLSWRHHTTVECVYLHRPFSRLLSRDPVMFLFVFVYSRHSHTMAELL